jgi:hypothetical protein
MAHSCHPGAAKVPFRLTLVKSCFPRLSKEHLVLPTDHQCITKSTAYDNTKTSAASRENKLDEQIPPPETSGT